MKMQLFESVRDIYKDSQAIARRRYGVIDVVDGRLVGVRLRPFPAVISAIEAAWIGHWQHRGSQKNRCLLYYNQPIAHRNYLALVYVVSTLGTTLSTLRLGLGVLDEIARIKRSDAILCEVTNRRLSDRLLERIGWQRHLHDRRRRHFIRRFYGNYPRLLDNPLSV